MITLDAHRLARVVLRVDGDHTWRTDDEMVNVTDAIDGNRVQHGPGLARQSVEQQSDVCLALSTFLVSSGAIRV
ncbi:hypothetical protein QQ002_06555 [Demequina sp. SYSU T0a273]|uniref:Uncharacterized protein n=1 Tax=Demequina lignilytica TaxID=3051663 RepID=A0AB35MHI8_9MICO|nr:hypothetical protein [Demequina sp. SYSU T0a273]MDN4483196.1 hypothetical protein [Demequina sp. SYSU T0a273]